MLAEVTVKINNYVFFCYKAKLIPSFSHSDKINIGYHGLVNATGKLYPGDKIKTQPSTNI